MTAKCKEPEHRRSFEGLAPLTAEVRAIARPILGRHGFVGLDILSQWEDIVGTDLARGIRPQKLTFEGNKRTDGTLHVQSAGGAFAMIFEHQKARVIDRINTFFGYPAIARIKIWQGAFRPEVTDQPETRPLTAAEAADLTKRVAGIEDPDLRDCAYRIGQEILRKKA